MNSLQELQHKLENKQAERAKISSEGEVLSDCWIAKSGAGGTARTKNLYWQLRSRRPIFNGKKTKYIKETEVEGYEAAIDRGKRIKALSKEIEGLQQCISKVEALLAALY